MFPTKSTHQVYLLLLIALLAHGLCVASQFFMDDFYFVTDLNGYDPARWSIQMGNYLILDGGPRPTYTSTQQALLSGLLITWHTKLFGTAPWLFHCWNLGLHIACVLMAWRCFGAFLCRFRPEHSSNELLAYLGALIFACHPFCSETLNYAKCVYMQLVTLTVIGASHQFLLWGNSGRRGHLWKFLLWALAAYFSYHYGFPILMGVITCLAVVINGPAGFIKLSRWLSGSWLNKGIMTALTIGFLVVFSDGWLHNIKMMLAGGNYPTVDHWMTQCRVYWCYIWRMLLPIQLASDHHLPWSRGLRDWVAILSMLAILAGIGWSLRQAIKPQGSLRWVGASILLLSIPLLIRLLHPTPEVMVEYRAYPAMPWASLLLAAGVLAIVQHWNIAQRLPQLLLLVFILLSVKRSSVWSSTETLCQANLAVYPKNMRAMGHLYIHHLRNQDLPAIEKLHTHCVQTHEELAAFNASNTSRYYDPKRLAKFLFLEELRYIDALADLRSPNYRPEMWAEIESRWSGYSNNESNPVPAPMPWNWIYIKTKEKYVKPDAVVK